MIQTKLIALLAIAGTLITIYIGSIYAAYNKGYNKHVEEVARQATEVVMGSHTDILVAAQNVQEKEKEIKEDEVCSSIWTFDLRDCLRK